MRRFSGLLTNSCAFEASRRPCGLRANFAILPINEAIDHLPSKLLVGLYSYLTFPLAGYPA